MAKTNTDLSAYKLAKGESDWHEKYNELIDAILPTIQSASKTKIYYGTSDDPSTSGWEEGSIYIQIES